MLTCDIIYLYYNRSVVVSWNNVFVSLLLKRFWKIWVSFVFHGNLPLLRWNAKETWKLLKARKLCVRCFYLAQQSFSSELHQNAVLYSCLNIPLKSKTRESRVKANRSKALIVCFAELWKVLCFFYFMREILVEYRRRSKLSKALVIAKALMRYRILT